MPNTRSTVPGRQVSRNTRQNQNQGDEEGRAMTEHSNTHSSNHAEQSRRNPPTTITIGEDQLKALFQEVAARMLGPQNPLFPAMVNPKRATGEQPEEIPRVTEPMKNLNLEEGGNETHGKGKEKTIEKPSNKTSEKDLMRDELSKQMEALQQKLAAFTGENPVSFLQKRLSPFSKEIMAESVKGDFRTPPLPKFEGKGDPQEHITAFESTMQLYNLSDAINCRIFITTLAGRAQTWFAQLEPESIYSYEQLSLKFLNNFASNKRCVRGAAHLYRIRQKEGETLRNFMLRFNDEKLNVPNLSIEMVTNVLIQGLNPGRFLSNLAMDPPRDFDSLLREAERCINEEEVVLMKLEDRKGNKKEEKKPVHERLGTRSIQDRLGSQTRRESPPRRVRYGPMNMSMTTLLREIEDQPGLVKLFPPVAQKRPYHASALRKYCQYHKDVGHNTEDCRHLAAELERLTADGLLEVLYEKLTRKMEKRTCRSKSPKRRRSRSRSRSPRRKPHPPVQENQNKKVIHTISGGAAGGDSSRSRRRSFQSLGQRMQMQTARPVLIVQEPANSITFGDADKEGVIYPHSDPMVITLDVMGYDVKRVLIDNGSSANIMCLETFEQLGLKETMLESVNTPLTGFGGAVTDPLGVVTLKTSMGEGSQNRVEMVEYLVVYLPLSYNVILGRS